MATRKRETPRTIVRVVPYKHRPFGLRWTTADGVREVSSGFTRRRDAERAAVELEEQLATNNRHSTEISWRLFRQRYEEEKLATLSDSSLSLWTAAANWLDKTVTPKKLAEVTKSLLSEFQAILRVHELSDESIRTYLRTIKAALGWAVEVDLLGERPQVKLPRRTGGAIKMRSRAINAEEFERILMLVQKVRPRDAEVWKRFLSGLWHSGLRVDELRRLSWDEAADLTITEEFGLPLIRMLAAGHKSRRDEYQPITPEFWSLIKVPPGQREGLVFRIPNRHGKQFERKSVIRIISAIGAAAGVITDAASGKTATSHDIGRRAFLTRMDKMLSIAELQKWARHRSPETTMGYYHHRTAIELAKKVWSDS